MERQHHFFQAVSLLLAVSLSAGTLAMPAAAAGCPHTVTGTRSEQLSCTEMGATVTTCLDCGEELSRVYDQPPLGHLYKSAVTQEATAEQDGVRTYTCIRCSNTYTESIPKLEAPAKGTDGGASSLPDADLPDGQQPEDPSLTAPGGEGNGSGGESQDGSEEQDPSGGMDNPSDTEGGQQEACRHVWEPISRATPATCTEEARYYHTCKLCGLEEVDFTSPALGHKYTSEITRSATVEREGERTYTCIRCGDSYTEAIPKLPQAEVALKTGNRDSGSLDMEKLSQKEIQSLLADNPLTLPEEVFDVKPSVTAPFSAGKVKAGALQAAVDRLNALRRIAGLPSVSLDLSLCESAQYGAVIQAANGSLSHSPSRPAGMDSAFYQQAKSAASSSNLHSGRTLTGAVDGFMDDSGSNNLSSVGHRRWQLNPTMGKVGFGYAQGVRGGGYVAKKVFDRSGAGCDYDFIAWPASGNFPAQLFGGDIAWSITLNPAEYQTPGKSTITVTLTRDSGGRTWSFSSRGSDGYFNVDTSGYGVANCIIFRPDGIDGYDGAYTVRIDGLRAKNGQNVADFTYQVDFFGGEAADQGNAAEQPGQAQTGTQTGAQTGGQTISQTGGTQAQGSVFRDVPASYWAADAIRSAVDRGIVNGYADGTFHPTASVTYAHFNAMMARTFYPGQAEDGQSGRWWSQYVALNREHGILNGTTLQYTQVRDGSYDGLINESIDRYNMAAMMYNLLLDQDAPLPSSTACTAAQESIGDWASIPVTYRDAVSTCYALGLLNGQKDGNFGGRNPMTRAQGCVVLARLADCLA